jgi:hypothetical protein
MMTAFKHLLPESTFQGLQAIEKGYDKIIEEIPLKKELQDVGYNLLEKAKTGHIQPQNEPSWRFEGYVYDVIREEPVPNARVTFSNDLLRDVETNTTTCDDWGYFRIAVPSLGKNAYNIQIDHPDYFSQTHWTRDALKKSRQERYLLGTGYVQFHPVSGTYQGSDTRITRLELYTYPLHLTPAEEREKTAAFQRYRAGS